MICPLCSDHDLSLYEQEKHRSYYKCQKCDLVFVPRDQMFTPPEEKLRYENHINYGPVYENYMEQILGSIQPFLKSGERGLDFGSGKSTYVAQVLSERNFPTVPYDLFFHPDQTLLQTTYDFIIMSEVIEHLRDLPSDLNLIKKCLNPKASLFVKTKLLPESDFKNWFYKRDTTHVQFFNHHSFKFLADQWNFEEAEEIGTDLFLFRNKR